MLLSGMLWGDQWTPVLLIIGCVFLILLIPYLFFVAMLQNTFRLIAPENRTMRPEQVWLLLVPVFNLGWQFIVIDRMADSLAAELQHRNIPFSERPGYNIGLACCICVCLCFTGVLSGVAPIGCLVLWILYWVKINEYRQKILSGNATGDEAQLQ